jgi:hypothetical protein
MKTELDEYLCKAYPKIFADRNADMKTTAMCWGFECSDGWFNILNQLCGNIQHHIDWSIKNHNFDIEYNKMVADAKEGNWDRFNEYYKSWIDLEDRREEILESELKEVRQPCHQVVAEQVKEKFGTLRFYYNGGDDYISGLVSMAESMSGVTCETCGSPGTRTGGGWIKTACTEHSGKDFNIEEE